MMLNRPHTTTIYRSKSFDNKSNNKPIVHNKIKNYNNDDGSSLNDAEYDTDSDWNSVNDENNDKNRNDINGKKSNMIWFSNKKVPALIIFSPEVVLRTTPECKNIGIQFHLTYKFQGGEKRLIKTILDGHGFKEVHPHSSEFNVLWTGNNLKTYLFRTLKEYQKVNHFPRSCELTRKDRLYKNVQKMQQEKGSKISQIVPVTFIMPYEIDEFYSTFYKEKGVWIVKPVALSRGRGIYLINHPDQVPLDENLVVSKYITNPLLIEGFKFDLRLYVAVTSFDPLVFYLYEEGLTRFATCKYDKSFKNMKNSWMHLTNYSVNKKNKKYVRCDDPDVEDYGNKWSMSAMLRYLAREGKDTFGMMMQIEELIIKTLLAVESPLASAARMFIPHRGNCFEVFGFDILVDEDLKPWVLEVNLSPSLDCDAVLDLKIKSNMISDLFTLTGVHCQDPIVYSNRSRFAQKSDNNNNNNNKQSSVRSRPHSANLLTSTLGNTEPSTQSRTNFDPRPATSKSRASSLARSKSEHQSFEGLSQNEASIFKSINDEHNRRGGWIRLFPTSDTWEFFSQYLEIRSTSYNLMLHQKLFPKRWLHGNTKRTSISRAKILQSSYSIYKQTNNQNILNSDTGASLNDAIKRYKLYERKLGDNTNNNAFEAALKRFVVMNQENAVKKTDTYDSDATNNNDDASTSSKPPLCNPSLTSISSSKTNNSKKDVYILDGSKKNPYNNNNTNNNYNSTNNVNKPDVQNEYDLSTILKNLDDGYYMSRAQVRYAFTLYLSKIQMRMVIESEVKDESNVQQMELVLRFMKKASCNLSQQFKVYIPSKRLPIYEQKRMLSKELSDFLYIYKKDTDLLRIDSNYDLEKSKNKKFTFNDTLLINFLNKCSEMQLEEIMSSYMKNSKDSSAFLGTNKNKHENNSNENNNHKVNNGSKKPTNIQTTQETTIKKNNKTVTSVGVSKLNNNHEYNYQTPNNNINNNNENSFSSSTNSSTISSTDNKKKTNKVIDEIKIQKGIERSKSAQVDKKTNPITREKINDDYYKNILHSAATMTANLQSNNDQKSIVIKKPKSATGPRRLPLNLDENQTKSPIETYKRPVSAFYVEKHKSQTQTRHQNDDDNSFKSDDSSMIDNKNLSEKLKNLNLKQQSRQYSASTAKSILTIDINKENTIKNELQQIFNNENKKNSIFNSNVNTQVSIDLENSNKIKTKILGTLERYSPNIFLTNRNNPMSSSLSTSSKPPPAPITTTTLLTTNSYKFK